MNSLRRFILLLAVAAAIETPSRAGDARTAGFSGTPIRGKWSQASTWAGGVLPVPGDNIIVSAGDTLIADVSISVGDLTVGDGFAGSEFRFSDSTQVTITVTGGVLINALSSFRTVGSAVPSTPNIDTLFVYGDFVHQGARLDLRAGSGPAHGVLYIVFVGSGNSVLTSTGVYNSTTSEFNGITFKKTGGGRVILGSDIFLAGGSSTYPASNAYLDFISGIVETGPYVLVSLSTTSAVVRNYSPASYVIGTLGRGMSSSAGATKEFPVGDELGYRPIKVRSTTPGGGTGHFARVRIVTGNANSGSSTLTGGIDKVSTVRYYKITYDKGSTATASMSFDRFQVAYGASDGITAGSVNLRTAYSTDSLASWTGCGQVANIDTTDFSTTPAYWNADSVAIPIALNSLDKSLFVAQARATGTTDNSLDYTLVGVDRETGMTPTGFGLEQNYPNPFNPSTVIRYRLASAAMVQMVVYDILGRDVAALVREEQQAGTYATTFDAHGLASGIYTVRLTAGAYSEARKMMLVR